jgi:DNA-binding transcriptional MerR regulator
MIRRLRDLGLPLDDVRTIVRAPDPRSRDAALVAHLRRMERQLQDTQQTVRSLRSLLEQPGDEGRVQRRHIPATTALLVAERVRAESVMAWWMDVFTVLHRALAHCGGTRSGPDGALFPEEFFEDEVGDLDRTYGVLGTWVLDRAARAGGPIREYYPPTGDPDDLLAHVTEVCWPVPPSVR